jgi:hypothetical protein
MGGIEKEETEKLRIESDELRMRNSGIWEFGD